MHQIVRDWMSSPVVVIPPEISAGQGMRLMRRRGIRSLVVDLTRQNGVTYGIVTVSDIRDKIVSRGRRPGKVTIAEIMSAPIECAKPSWSLRKAAIKMQEIGVNHLPVENRRGSLIGMISVMDIFTAVEEAGWGSDPERPDATSSRSAGGSELLQRK